ncbi:hypothetical protein, partial [Pseudomonas aeruginosa]|uniref:hypothetical protein n=1 Tax=Pseudomonas aeruginosa TaxID=287 RepID=UPI001551F1DE
QHAGAEQDDLPVLAQHLGAPERWVGGVCLRAGTAHWALDEQDRPVWREDPRH